MWKIQYTGRSTKEALSLPLSKAPKIQGLNYFCVCPLGK